jgi:DNA-binding NarL/FixJ family response regulator
VLATPTTQADVVLCDDHPVFAEALAAVLARHGFLVRAVAHRAADVVDLVTTHRPLVCVVDRHFADGDGLVELPRVRAASPGTRVVLLTADRDPRTARRAMDAGAAGYLCKTAGVAALVSTLTRVAAGEVVNTVPAPRSALHGPEQVEAHRLAAYLTPRERDCLAMMVDGLGTAAIAARLGVSVATVRTYAQAVLTKLGVHSRLEAASFAVRHSLLDTPA